uniref:Putative methionine sulfoxide reductase n=1 Tax=Trypanosoma vivax (strain Y486) TaxID=1055687 RepID=G0UDA0_TRYVY|nr:putative methionine sulfoxide reductase [Trypanosoma vivax Y486]
MCLRKRALASEWSKLPLRTVPALTISSSHRLLFISSLNAMTHCANEAQADGSKNVGEEEWRARLTPQQFRVLREKATDTRFGPYFNHFAPGTYHCVGCGTLLYTSAMKFYCQCGWPSFFDCVPLSVREAPDRDGIRTEILCNACNGHLGHIFRGEGFNNPPPNERHCVNESAIYFKPQDE